MLRSTMLIAGFSLGSSVEQKKKALLGWNPGNTCPAYPENYDGTPGAYGDMGFEWVGDKIGYPDAEIGNPQAACWDGGGDGLIGPVHGATWVGVYYSMCNPKLGCTNASEAYTCTAYTNVTGTRPVKGMLSGRAQGPVQATLQPAIRTSALATHYANPFTGGCYENASALDDANASSLTVVELVDFKTGNHLRSHNVSGSTCAPACGCRAEVPGFFPGCLDVRDPQILRCPTTNLPANTTATPRCMLGPFPPPGQGFVSPTGCVLVCDPSDPSGTGGPTSKCPAGATCKKLYGEAAARAGIFDSGICTYDR